MPKRRRDSHPQAERDAEIRKRVSDTRALAQRLQALMDFYRGVPASPENLAALHKALSEELGAALATGLLLEPHPVFVAQRHDTGTVVAIGPDRVAEARAALERERRMYIHVVGEPRGR